MFVIVPICQDLSIEESEGYKKVGYVWTGHFIKGFWFGLVQLKMDYRCPILTVINGPIALVWEKYIDTKPSVSLSIQVKADSKGECRAFLGELTESFWKEILEYATTQEAKFRIRRGGTFSFEPHDGWAWRWHTVEENPIEGCADVC